MIMVRAGEPRRARWVPSPLGAVLKAWCGHLLLIITAQHDYPPGDTVCPAKSQLAVG
jgi:hypothetical protein